MSFKEAELCQFVESTWDSMLQRKAQRGAPMAPLEKGEYLVGCVTITGNWEGAVTVACPMTGARQAAALMFAMEPDAVSLNEVQDALGELANMLAGQVKTLFPEPCKLSLPVVSDSYVKVLGCTVLSELDFVCDDHTFRVSILKR